MFGNFFSKEWMEVLFAQLLFCEISIFFLEWPFVFLYSSELMKLCRLLTRYMTIQQSTARRHLATYSRKTPPVGTLSIRRMHLCLAWTQCRRTEKRSKNQDYHTTGPELPSELFEKKPDIQHHSQDLTFILWTMEVSLLKATTCWQTLLDSPHKVDGSLGDFTLSAWEARVESRWCLRVTDSSKL